MKRIELDTARGKQRVPPGQRLVGERFPVLTAGETPGFDIGEWDLCVTGMVDHTLSLSLEEFEALPQVEVVADMHCVTSWSRLDNVWRGVSAKYLMELAGPLPEARFVSVSCDGGYTTNLPLAELYEGDALFATHHDGEPLTPGHGHPLRLVIPRLYGWKSAKWVREVELVSEERPGFWERNGYHAYGDPWREQRYS